MAQVGHAAITGELTRKETLQAPARVAIPFSTPAWVRPKQHAGPEAGKPVTLRREGRKSRQSERSQVCRAYAKRRASHSTADEVGTDEAAT